MEFGVKAEAIEEVLSGFTGLAHRMELVGEYNGRVIYNDSKATTPDAVLCDLESLSSVVLIAGGRNKGLDLTSLIGLSNKLRHVIGIGESGREICAVFADTDVPTTPASSMAEAVQVAFSSAKRFDAIVLSPGCTSWDWYASYEDRGTEFVECVKRFVPILLSDCDE